MSASHLDLAVSLATLLPTAPLLGQPLEDRSPIRDAQDLGLLDAWDRASRLRLDLTERARGFYFGAFDVLVDAREGRRHFWPIELNGTGTIGITSLPTPLLRALLDAFGGVSERLSGDAPVVLLTHADDRSTPAAGANRHTHERLLLADALRAGLMHRYGAASVVLLSTLAESRRWGASAPVVVLGTIEQFEREVEARDGSLWLFQRPVSALCNDRLCASLFDRHALDPGRVVAVNGLYELGSDKGRAYEVFNAHLARGAYARLTPAVPYQRLTSTASLVAAIEASLAAHTPVVMKPRGGGRGTGIEFFLRPEPRGDLVARVQRSVDATATHYRRAGGAFPYTLTPFVDCCAVDAPGHRFDGHKYELRVIVYREGSTLHACPSIVKVASQRYDASRPERAMLLNNISASTNRLGTSGAQHMLPLASRETLSLLGLDEDDIAELCRFCVGAVGHALCAAPGDGG